MPYTRKDLRDFSVVRTMGEFAWCRGPDLVTPPSLYLDGPNRFVAANPEKYGPHGYVIVQLDGEDATEAMYTADGIEVFQNHFG